MHCLLQSICIFFTIMFFSHFFCVLNNYHCLQTLSFHRRTTWAFGVSVSTVYLCLLSVSICRPQIYLARYNQNLTFESGMKTKCKMCAKIFHFKCVYFSQPVSENSVFRTTFIHKCTVKTTDSRNASH